MRRAHRGPRLVFVFVVAFAAMFAVPKWRHWAENKLRKPMAQIGEVVFINVTISLFAVGGVAALVSGIKDFGNVNQLFVDVRRAFGRPIILGLEILVAADIIQTITVDPSIESVSVLGILVAVRIALSFSLDIEVDGMLPWRRAQTEAELGATTDKSGTK